MRLKRYRNLASLLFCSVLCRADTVLSEEFLLFLADSTVIDGELTDPLSMEELKDVSSIQNAGIDQGADFEKTEVSDSGDEQELVTDNGTTSHMLDVVTDESPD